jgi:hypothetical protein
LPITKPPRTAIGPWRVTVAGKFAEEQEILECRSPLDLSSDHCCPDARLHDTGSPTGNLIERSVKRRPHDTVTHAITCGPVGSWLALWWEGEWVCLDCCRLAFPKCESGSALSRNAGASEPLFLASSPSRQVGCSLVRRSAGRSATGRLARCGPMSEELSSRSILIMAMAKKPATPTGYLSGGSPQGADRGSGAQAADAV